jgi:hypothetical protein
MALNAYHRPTSAIRPQMQELSVYLRTAVGRSVMVKGCRHSRVARSERMADAIVFRGWLTPSGRSRQSPIVFRLHVEVYRQP